MKRNGFTLIELLAVIVILAIIALIAIPIILNIVDDAEEKSAERSIELYASAVNNAIAEYRLNNTVAPENFSDLTVEYDGDVQCNIQKLYPDKTIYLGECTVNGGEKEYSYGTLKVAQVCTVAKQDATKYSVGDEVTCVLSESTDKFYIIEEQPLTATHVQMLTEKNIHTTNYRQSDDAGYVEFSSNSYWDSSVSSYPADVYGETNDIVKPIVDKYVSYLNIKLTEASGELLTMDQAKSLNCNSTSESCAGSPNWLTTTDYWLGTAGGGSAGDPTYVWHIDNWYGEKYFSNTCGICCGGIDVYGVRPVITIPTSAIK